jgi:hypothetical protein
LWNGSLKRDIQGFKPGMTESEAKQRLSDCEPSGHKIFCPAASKDERFELSLTEHTRLRLVKEVTYVFPAGGATLETMAKNVMVQFGVPTQSLGFATQWQSERSENGADTANAPLLGRVGPERSVASIDLCYKKASPQSAQGESAITGASLRSATNKVSLGLSRHSHSPCEL